MVGREKEIRELNNLYNSGKPELVVIYGRRRVGKTYLVDEVFRNRITFSHAGMSPIEGEEAGSLRRQLDHFLLSLQIQGMGRVAKPKSWLEAFNLLEKYLQEIDNGSRQVVFLDELPWMDTPRSGFITAFEAFWNSWACHRKNLMVVVCGSANAWILDKLINNHGGLYGRVTHEIKLLPFSLSECEQFFSESGIQLSRYDIVQSYMACGGIPYYLHYFTQGLSAAQNIDQLFFVRNARLANEYERLFQSAFDQAGLENRIVELLYRKNAGYTRNEIICQLKVNDGGAINGALRALLAGDFVEKYTPFGMSKKEVHYKLIDPFCLFYLCFVKERADQNENFWSENQTLQAVVSWRGIAFENVCFNHVPQIKQALGVAGVVSEQSAWSKKEDDREGTQIDLLIQRNDNVVNMCEMKFYSGAFSVTKDYWHKIMHRVELLSSKISPKMVVHSTLVTTYGLEQNEYSGAFVKVITLKELFAKMA